MTIMLQMNTPVMANSPQQLHCVKKLLFSDAGAQPGHFVGRGNEDPALSPGVYKMKRHV